MKIDYLKEILEAFKLPQWYVEKILREKNKE